MTADEMIQEMRSDIKYLKDKIESVQPVHTCPDALLSSHKILDRLQLESDDKAWRAIRKVLIADYGMSNVGGGGFRIRESQFQKFLAENYV